MAKSTVTQTRLFMHNMDLDGSTINDDDVVLRSSRRPSASGWGSAPLRCCEDHDGAGQYNESPSILLSSDNGDRLFRGPSQHVGPASPVSGADGCTASVSSDAPLQMAPIVMGLQVLTKETQQASLEFEMASTLFERQDVPFVSAKAVYGPRRKTDAEMTALKSTRAVQTTADVMTTPRLHNIKSPGARPLIVNDSISELYDDMEPDPEIQICLPRTGRARRRSASVHSRDRRTTRKHRSRSMSKSDNTSADAMDRSGSHTSESTKPMSTKLESMVTLPQRTMRRTSHDQYFT